MARTRTDIEWAAGKLISAIQKEWAQELGTDAARESEVVLEKAHDLLQGTKGASLSSTLGNKSILQFIGPDWVAMHPSVAPFVEQFAMLIDAHR
jgi:hypothetical protein